MADTTDISPPHHPSFLQPADQSIPVWRYMDMPKLVSMLARRELHLARLDLLPDKYEGTLTKPTRSLMLSALASAAPAGAGLDVQRAEQTKN